MPLKLHKFCKRTFDILFSLFVLAFLSPLYLLLAILVKLSSKGPIFYVSRRIGRRGKIIHCFKFRTMHQDADKHLPSLLQSNPLLAKEWATYQKLHSDPRITPIGYFLRKTSLDELPQFVNVLLGDLSVVGPRALLFTGSSASHLSEMRRLYGEHIESILAVRPGITGIWQISGRSSLSLQKRCEMDIAYVSKQTVWRDIKVICKTIPAILSSKGAC